MPLTADPPCCARCGRHGRRSLIMVLCRDGRYRCQPCLDAYEAPRAQSRHVLEGIVTNTHEEVYPAFGVAVAGTWDLALYDLLERLEGQRVRVTIDVLPEGAED